MIGDVIATFRKTTATVNQTFVQKSQITTSTHNGRFMLKKLILQSCLFKLSQFPALNLRESRSKQHKNSQVPVTLSHNTTNTEYN